MEAQTPRNESGKTQFSAIRPGDAEYERNVIAVNQGMSLYVFSGREQRIESNEGNQR